MKGNIVFSTKVKIVTNIKYVHYIFIISQLNSPGHVQANPTDRGIDISWENPEGPRTGTRFEYTEVRKSIPNITTCCNNVLKLMVIEDSDIYI